MAHDAAHQVAGMQQDVKIVPCLKKVHLTRRFFTTVAQSFTVAIYTYINVYNLPNFPAVRNLKTRRGLQPTPPITTRGIGKFFIKLLWTG